MSKLLAVLVASLFAVSTSFAQAPAGEKKDAKAAVKTEKKVVKADAKGDKKDAKATKKTTKKDAKADAKAEKKS